MTRRRRLVVLRGEPGATRDDALRLCAMLGDDAVLWVGGEAAGRFVEVRAAGVKKKLGQAYDAVVLDLHRGIDADVIGQCHGFVWGGGALVLRMPPPGERPLSGREKLACWPYAPEDVATRFWDRFERCLDRSDARAQPESLEPSSRHARGTEDQRRAVARLSEALRSSTPSATALLSDRGRGKSSALGLAIRSAVDAGVSRIAVAAPNAAATAELFRFVTGAPEPPTEGPVRFVAPLELARGDARWDAVVIDEAAQLPVPLLQRIVRRQPTARLAFATTARGYEGTGRGFVLRFLEWLESEPRPLTTLTLTEPIRWDAGDPLERWVMDALALDAQPAAPEALEPFDPAELHATELDRDALAVDERRLRDFFGLLVHAHYRTTPTDLQRLLDAPNLRVHALLHRERVVAATLVALEGGLPEAVCERLARGDERIRGHALPDTLICHSGKTDAGRLSMVRSVRIASHPALRRRGLARRLVDHVHEAYAPALFGTLFGATPELLRFRREVGYRLVRVGISRGNRTGEPAAVMLRPVSVGPVSVGPVSVGPVSVGPVSVGPVSARARALVETLRAELARDLPLTVELLNAEGELDLEPALIDALYEDLPPAATLGEGDRRRALASYAFGPRPYEAAAFAVTDFVRAHPAALETLEPDARALIERRVLERRPWPEVAASAGLETVHAAMRATRRAVRRFAIAADPSMRVFSRAEDERR